jgi:hypothetical protein
MQLSLGIQNYRAPLSRAEGAALCGRSGSVFGNLCDWFSKICGTMPGNLEPVAGHIHLTRLRVVGLNRLTLQGFPSPAACQFRSLGLTPSVTVSGVRLLTDDPFQLD